MKQLMQIFTFVLVSLVAFSCGDSNNPVKETSSENSAGSLLKPTSSGPYVIRTQTEFAIAYPDERRGMSAVLGVDVADLCSGNFDFDLVDLLEIRVPQDANRLIQLITSSNVRTSVWPFTTFDCALFASTTPLATGFVDVVGTDNDFFAFLNPPNPYHNAWGFIARGTLTNSSGEDVMFRGHVRLVWDGVDFSDFQASTAIILN